MGFFIRPSRTMSGITVVVGLFLIVVGVFMLFQWSGNPIVWIWLALAILITAYHAYNALTGKGPAIWVARGDRGNPEGRER